MNKRFRLKDGREVIVKRLQLDDFISIEKFKFYYLWHKEVSIYLNKDYTIKEIEEENKKLLELLSDNSHNIIIGAIFKDNIVGRCNLYLNNHPKTMHVAKWGIAIHPKFQNQGLGHILLLIMEKIAKKRGLIKLRASFLEPNEAAKKLYLKKLNYQVEGRSMYGAKMKDGKYVDIISIGKLLDN